MATLFEVGGDRMLLNADQIQYITEHGTNGNGARIHFSGKDTVLVAASPRDVWKAINKAQLDMVRQANRVSVT